MKATTNILLTDPASAPLIAGREYGRTRSSTGEPRGSWNGGFAQASAVGVLQARPPGIDCALRTSAAKQGRLWQRAARTEPGPASDRARFVVLK